MGSFIPVTIGVAFLADAGMVTVGVVDLADAGMAFPADRRCDTPGRDRDGQCRHG